MNKDNIQLIIPMSGKGKRFKEAGYKNIKPLIEVDGYPMIYHVVNLFKGVNDIIFICDEDHLKETDLNNILKQIAPQAKILNIKNNTKGPVNAVHQVINNINKNKEIIVSYCDYGTEWDFDKFLSEVRKNDYDGAIPCYIGFHPHMLGSDNYAFCKEKDKILLEIKEKEPFSDNKMQEYASNGTYYFKNGFLVEKYFKKLVDLDINIKGEFYVSLVYNLLLKDNLKVGIFEIKKMLQWGTPYDLEVYKKWSNFFKKSYFNKQKIFNPPSTTLVLPMAGKGSRFQEEGYSNPKPLINVDQKPMILEAVDSIPQSDNNIFICLEEHLNLFNLREVLKNNYKNVKIKSIKEVTQGQACTCEIGIKEFNVNLNDPIMISACDNGVRYNSDLYLSLVNNKNIDVIVWSFRNNPTSKINPNMYSWLEVDENNFIKHVSCKKFIYDDPLKTHAIIGTMFFRKARYFIDGLNENYKHKIKTNNEFYVDDVINQNIQAGLKVKVFEVEDYICWGTPNDYKTYNYWKEYFIKT